MFIPNKYYWWKNNDQGSRHELRAANPYQAAEHVIKYYSTIKEGDVIHIGPFEPRSVDFDKVESFKVETRKYAVPL